MSVYVRNPAGSERGYQEVPPASRIMEAHHWGKSVWEKSMLVWAGVSSDATVHSLRITQQVLEECEAAPIRGVCRDRYATGGINSIISEKLCSFYQSEYNAILLAQQRQPHVLQTRWEYTLHAGCCSVL
jgi:hypothetical protein